MPRPLHIRWYETTADLDKLHTAHYSRLGETVCAAGVGGIFVLWHDVCENWGVKWEKTESRYEYHFEWKKEGDLADPLKIQIPLLKFNDRWFQSHSYEFNLARLLNNRVDQLSRFVREKNLYVPDGTLFIVTQAGIREALANNRPWSLIMGYSSVEPTPEFPCTPMHSNIPELRRPKGFEVIEAAEPTRLTRFERPWVI